MTIGIPQALLYYRYGVLWQTFFEQLGCAVILSGESDQGMLSEGEALSDNECCLPAKMFAGHAARLAGRCDYIFAPRLERLAKDEEFCVRFWGLTDVVRATFPGTAVLSYNLQGQKAGSELRGFLDLGHALGKGSARSLRAYHLAKSAQRTADTREAAGQTALLTRPGIKILLAAQPYISHDKLIGGPLVRLLRAQGAQPVFAEHCDRATCRKQSAGLTGSLYWTMNKEIVGAISLLRPQIDGVILVSAFPCGTDSLVNELILRRVKDFPITQIILDGQQGEAGLQTRIECFMDIVKERRRSSVS